MTTASCFRRERCLAFVLTVAILWAGAPMPTAAQGAPDAQRIIDEMIRVSETALRRIETLRSAGYSRDRTFSESGVITNDYNRALLALSERLEALGAGGRAFVDSREGKELMEKLNANMSRIKQAVIAVIPGNSVRQFGKVEVPLEKQLKAKYDFMANYIRGTRITDGSSTESMRRQLDQTYLLASSGNSQARANFDKTFSTIVESYSKDDRAEVQYNLGLLYSDLGDREQAIAWFTKASRQGLALADERLKELNGK